MESRPLKQFAKGLNKLTQSPTAQPHYEMLSDALIWDDEKPDLITQFETDTLGWLRSVWRYRTIVLLGMSDQEYEESLAEVRKLYPQFPGIAPLRKALEEALRLCPKWPGLAPERRDSGLVETFKTLRARSMLSLRKLEDAWDEAHKRPAD